MLLPRQSESEFKAEQNAVILFVNNTLRESSKNKEALENERLELLKINEYLYEDNQEAWAIIGRLMLVLHKHQYFLRVAMNFPDIADVLDSEISKAVKGGENAQ